MPGLGTFTFHMSTYRPMSLLSVGAHGGTHPHSSGEETRKQDKEECHI